MNRLERIKSLMMMMTVGGTLQLSCSADETVTVNRRSVAVHQSSPQHADGENQGQGSANGDDNRDSASAPMGPQTGTAGDNMKNATNGSTTNDSTTNDSSTNGSSTSGSSANDGSTTDGMTKANPTKDNAPKEMLPSCDEQRKLHMEKTAQTCQTDPSLCTKNKLELPAIFAEHMVLQRGTARVWGTGYAGEFITVKISSQQACATADQQGRWQVQLSELAAGGPFTLQVQGDPKRQALEVKDVLVGDVWLSSGQSNMVWSVALDAASDQTLTMSYPNIRFFNVAQVASATPSLSLQNESGGRIWSRALQNAEDRQAWASFSAVAFYFGRRIYEKTGVPIGLINAAWVGSNIEPWTPAASGGASNGENFNGMINPLVPLSLKGFLWYQGESNVGDGALYQKKLSDLILRWRERFQGPALPFYFVQIAPYQDYPEGFLPTFWEAQAKTMASVPQTGMAVISDLCDITDLHPRAKLGVGERLALWALAKDYGVTDTVFSGPIAKSMVVQGSTATITFDSIGAGLSSRQGAPLTPYFQVAGSDGKLYAASTATIAGDKVIVSSGAVLQPKTIYFAWTNGSQPTLVNSAGLPASAFRLTVSP